MPGLEGNDEAFLAKCIAGLRDKLIDITKRNSLISYKHNERAASFVRVVDESPDILFQKLRQGQMLFEPLPDSDEEPEDEKTQEFKLCLERARLSDEQYLACLGKIGETEQDQWDLLDVERSLRTRVRSALGLPLLRVAGRIDIHVYARAHGFNPSFDLCCEHDLHADHFGDNKIRVLHTREILERRLRTIDDRCRTYASETGIHTLHVAFGFIEWAEDESSSALHYAPILLVPATLSRKSVRGHYVYSISAPDEDAALNVALVERLRRQHGIEVPQPEVEEKPGPYFSRLEPILRGTPRLRIRQFVTIGIFAFHRMVVWRDLDPERWPDSSILKHRDVALLLGARGREKAEQATAPEEYGLEDERWESQAPKLILPADTSQHSAVLDAMRQRSLAIEGPPGTGKSQTIANLIAAALDQGKRVLFCAEKRAALEVVAKRLVERGFGPLMLELHSDRASKTALMASLIERDKAPQMRPVQDIEVARRDLTRCRDTLRRYLALLRRPVGELGLPLNALLWRMLRLQEELGEILPQGFLDQAVDQPQRISADDLEQSRRALRDVGRNARQIESEFGSLTGSLWHAARRIPGTAFQLEEVREALRTTINGFNKLCAFADEMEASYHIPITRTNEQTEGWLAVLSAMPQLDGRVCTERLHSALSSPADVQEQCKLLRAYNAALQRAKEIHPTPLTADISKLHTLLEALREHGVKRTSLTQLEAMQAAAQVRSASIKYIYTRLEPLLSAARLKPDAAKVYTIGVLLRALQQLDGAAPDIVARMESALLATDAKALLDEAGRAAEQLRQRFKDLAERADARLWTSYSAEALITHAYSLAGAGPLSRFLPAHRHALKIARSFALDPWLETGSLAELLQDLASWQADAKAFEERAELRHLFGAFWKGHLTDFESMRLARHLLERATTLMRAADMNQAANLLATDPIWRVEIRAAIAKDRALADALDSLEPYSTLVEARARAESEVGKIQSLLELAVTAGVCSGGELTTVDASIEARFALLHELHKSLASPPEAPAHFSWQRGLDEDPDRLEVILGLARSVRAAGLPPAIYEMLCSVADPVAIINSLIRSSKNGHLLLQAARSRWNDFRDKVGADTQAFLGSGSLERAEWDKVSQRLRQAHDDEDGMRLFAELFNKYMPPVEDAGVRFVYDAFAMAGKATEKLPEAYELVFIRSLLKHFLPADGKLLERLGGISLAEARERYRALDEQLYRLEAHRIISARLQDYPDPGIDYGPRSTWTGHALIRHELAKKRRHIPVRALIGRASQALQTMKPVWLMSPLSVAQYLPAGSAWFDLVVIDEASQMKPEFAVGAIARGGQVVVVGDPKQLPPSDFFETRQPSSDEEDDKEDIDSESILDLAIERLSNVRKLKWHYRSRHASLIAFSNRYFYERELIVFPNPVTFDEVCGVKHFFVGGNYERRVNEKEAHAVIKAAIGLMYSRPDLSIGIVTMNSDQRELIFGELARIAEDDEAVRAYRDRHENSIEPFFVKNLENVQGDERDVIIISTLYGPAPGKSSVLQRFGPINRENGWRRLNVLFTRAKMSTMIYTSLKPNDILVGEGSSRGVRALRAYLEYAAGGAVADSAEGGEADSDFEVFVADRLRAAGYEVVPQVGVEGFRIDLGVRHASYPIGFIAGVECDGATYHSGLSVRDRDRIRQDVLEGLGWRIYRIWSTDWFTDADRETKRLLEWLAVVQRAAAAQYAVQQGAAPRSDPDSDAEAEVDSEVEEQRADLERGMPSSVEDAAQDQPSARSSQWPPRRPEGRKHVTPEGIAFYEPMTGYYEVYLSDRIVGDVERINNSLAPTHFKSRPHYRACMRETSEAFNRTDIYDAVREVVRRAASMAAE